MGKSDPPLWMPRAWYAAAERAGFQCECASTVRQHTHARYGGRCPVKYRSGDVNGRLYLGRDGFMRCARCHDIAEAIYKKSNPEPDVDSVLF